MKRIAIGITIIAVLMLVGCNNVVTNKQINTTNKQINTTNSIDKTTKTKIMSSEMKQLKEEDFEVSYKNIIINKSSKIEDITKKLGFPEDYEPNNKGYISGNANYRRWNLCYPNYSNPEIRIIVLSEREYIGEEVKDGDSYIVGIYLEEYSTNRGLKVGDELAKVLQLYGKPDSFEKDSDCYGEPYFLRYSKGSSNLDITLDDDMKKVEYIFLDYNMKKSIEQQQITSN